MEPTITMQYHAATKATHLPHSSDCREGDFPWRCPILASGHSQLAGAHPYAFPERQKSPGGKPTQMLPNPGNVCAKTCDITPASYLCIHIPTSTRGRINSNDSSSIGNNNNSEATTAATTTVPKHWWRIL